MSRSCPPWKRRASRWNTCPSAWCIRATPIPPWPRPSRSATRPSWKGRSTAAGVSRRLPVHPGLRLRRPGLPRRSGRMVPQGRRAGRRLRHRSAHPGRRARQGGRRAGLPKALRRSPGTWPRIRRIAGGRHPDAEAVLVKAQVEEALGHPEGARPWFERLLDLREAGTFIPVDFQLLEDPGPAIPGGILVQARLPRSGGFPAEGRPGHQGRPRLRRRPTWKPPTAPWRGETVSLRPRPIFTGPDGPLP